MTTLTPAFPDRGNTHQRRDSSQARLRMQQKYVPMAEEVHSSIQASTMRRQPNSGETNVEAPVSRAVGLQLMGSGISEPNRMLVFGKIERPGKSVSTRGLVLRKQGLRDERTRQIPPLLFAGSWSSDRLDLCRWRCKCQRDDCVDCIRIPAQRNLHVITGLLTGGASPREAGATQYPGRKRRNRKCL